MDDLHILFSRSRYAPACLLAAYTGAFVLAFSLALGKLYLLLLCLALLFCALRDIRQCEFLDKALTGGIKYHSEQWYLMRSGSWEPVDLALYYHCAVFTVLQWQGVEQHRRQLVIWRDMLTAEERKILTVYFYLY